MSLGPLICDLQGPELTGEDRDVLGHPLVGGVILFSRNYESPEQLLRLTAAVHALRSPPLLVMVDQEGGRIQRFREGFSALPSAALIGGIHAQDARQGEQLAQDTGWLMAAELREAGVDFSFAPVLDLERGGSPVTCGRAFAREPEAVAALAGAYAQGMSRAGMSAVGKHFPGHGATPVDSHDEIPESASFSLQDLEREDLLPFMRLATELPAIMPAHIVFPQVDPLPVGFSEVWLRQILRGGMGFQGAIISDDINMRGASGMGDHLARAQAALSAGCDTILLCNNRSATVQVLDRLRHESAPDSQERMSRMRGRRTERDPPLRRCPEWQAAVARAQAALSQ